VLVEPPLGGPDAAAGGPVPALHHGATYHVVVTLLSDASGAPAADADADTITVVIVEDNPMVRAALRELLHGVDGFRVVAEAADGRAGLAAVARHLPTVTLLDHRMPVADGLDVLDRLAELTRVLMLTADGSAEVVRLALECGARGFIVHSELFRDDVPRAVSAIAAGQVWLSPSAAAVAVRSVRVHAEAESLLRLRFGLTRRERQLVELLVDGLSNAEIAATLVVAEKTVKNHLNHVYAKLGVASRSQAIARWCARA
jgi:DNA-binding NarL/FixJ family response regulator